MENYKEKYEKLYRFVNDLYPHMSDYCKEKVDGYFPELKENKDERIRKMLIEVIKRWHECALENNVVQDIKDSGDAIAWLEKQEDANKEYWRGYKEDKQEIIDKYSELEKQGEQKEINLVEILKHYPKETELYSPLYGKLWLAEVDEEHEIITCYKHPLSEGDVRAILEQEDTVSFYSNGTTGLPDFSISKDCMLFLYDSEKQGRQKPNFCHHEVDLSDCSEEYRKAYYDGWNNCNQQHSQLEAEQKPTWSKDDERMFSGLNSIVEDWYNTMSEREKEYYGDCGYIDWLKSLKETMKGE